MAGEKRIFTVGHSTHSGEAFLSLLAEAGVKALADVRRYPGSRRNPQFNEGELARALAGAGIGFEAFGEELGGRRRPVPGSPNGGWRVEQFQGYADHLASEAFVGGLERLERLAEEHPTAVMCAEADWHRCHRRLLADALLVRGWTVCHIRPGGALEEHELTSFAVREGQRLTYPPAQESLLSEG
jgi:uncharacterized protein (DUF488 family)